MHCAYYNLWPVKYRHIPKKYKILYSREYPLWNEMWTFWAMFLNSILHSTWTLSYTKCYHMHDLH